jgi:hypothetical protein
MRLLSSLGEKYSSFTVCALVCALAGVPMPSAVSMTMQMSVFMMVSVSS